MILKYYVKQGYRLFKITSVDTEMDHLFMTIKLYIVFVI